MTLGNEGYREEEHVEEEHGGDKDRGHFRVGTGEVGEVGGRGVVEVEEEMAESVSDDAYAILLNFSHPLVLPPQTAHGVQAKRRNRVDVHAEKVRI